MISLTAAIILVTGCSATFNSLFNAAYTQPEVYNLCVYSKDPEKYKPNCFKCPREVYSTATQACVNATDLPSNITYSAAGCLEENCKINYPKAAETPKPIEGDSLNILSNFLQSFSQYFNNRAKRSVDSNSLEYGEGPKYDGGFKIIGNKQTFASEMDIVFDYIT